MTEEKKLLAEIKELYGPGINVGLVSVNAVNSFWEAIDAFEAAVRADERERNG